MRGIEQQDNRVKNNGDNISKTRESFFSLAGLWSDRDIDAISIRKKAWPRRYDTKRLFSDNKTGDNHA